ncbi:iron reductase domain protein [Hypoxylon trugodes]|uniref:iron reductase domain protein n=1 Tax=Hypoxylon trugodes TaxID=326681 RepID=UPI0021921B15|nr:iron reductase domain protein [Hypoxylon trugodes]KAI1393353.1 iron reductase domain protein [Hypoxylon trugodes]
MGFIARIFAAAVLLASRSIAVPIAKTSRYCDAATGVCYSEATVGVAPIVWRIAIPAVEQAPFDMLFQVVAPKTVGWTGLALAGGMLYNPIVVGWQNGNTTVPTARFATAHIQPDVYDVVKQSTLKGSSVNETHWTLTSVCQGCSTWVHNGGAKEALDPGATAASFAWAAAPTPPIDPSDPTSPIGLHTEHGLFTIDLSAAKSDQFDAWVKQLS